MKYLFTSESVTEGHPDKICDQISDAILDAILTQDPESRIACETMTSTGLVMISGEITTTAKVDYTAVVRRESMSQHLYPNVIDDISQLCGEGRDRVALWTQGHLDVQGVKTQIITDELRVRGVADIGSYIGHKKIDKYHDAKRGRDIELPIELVGRYGNEHTYIIIDDKKSNLLNMYKALTELCGLIPSQIVMIQKIRPDRPQKVDEIITVDPAGQVYAESDWGQIIAIRNNLTDSRQKCVLVLDVDGVLINSSTAKISGLARLYSDIQRYILQHSK